jgi:hypothetical protein
MSLTTDRPTDDLTLAIFGQGLSGELHLPDDPAFLGLATPWNVTQHASRSFRAVVAAASAIDVVRTVRFAAARGLRVAVQCTGHGAVPIAGDDVLLLSTAALNGVEIDVERATARIGSGAVWQDVLDAATPYGLAPICGSAPNVGVVGFLTGGGIGPFVRSHGLSSDYVRSFELVTGEGALLRVSAEEHPELFWGLRGGKATLGIVTAVEIELPRLASFHGGTLFFAGRDAPKVLHAWQRATVGIDEAISTSLAIMQLPPVPELPAPLAGQMTVAVRIASVGGPQAAGVFASKILCVARPVFGDLGELPYSALASLHMDPVDPMPALERSVVISDLSSDLMDALLAVAGPRSASALTMVELRLLGGALARPAGHADAFDHRGAAANLMVIGALVPEIAHLIGPQAGAVIDAAAPHASGGVLPNFEPSGEMRLNARAYGPETRRRLAALADHHDPAGTFAVGQVIRDLAASAA